MTAQKVQAARGFGWFVDAWYLFRRDPMMWAGLALFWLIVALFFAFIPVLGPIVNMFLFPVVYGGLLRGARDLEAGSKLRVGLLWEILKEPDTRVQILVLGIVPLAYAMLANIFVLSQGPAPLAAVMLSVASIMLSLALVFAVPLVVFQRYEAIAALKTSFSAAIMNVAPLGIFLVVSTIVGVIAMTLTFGFVSVLLTPITVGALYQAYREIFREA